MRRFRRLVIFAIGVALHAKAKFLLLALLIAGGMNVFLLVTEMSRASSDDLEEAITEDAGRTGSYVLSLQSTFGLELDELLPIVQESVGDMLIEPPIAATVLPPVRPECPPFEYLGERELLVQRDVSGNPLPLPYGFDLPIETELCLGGQRIPSSALYVPTEPEQEIWGTGLFVASEYERAVLLNSLGPVTTKILLVTGQIEDLQARISDRLAAGLRPYADREATDYANSVSFHRSDSGNEIRAASEGVQLVYLLIGWGVLLLGGLGLLVAELMVIRDRSWFFGLARAVGATSRDVRTLILTDIALVVLAGTFLALVIALVAQPIVSDFGQRAFQTDLQLVRVTLVPQLLVGVTAILLIAGVYPARKATRLDPLEVMESR